MRNGLIAIGLAILALTFIDWGLLSKSATLEQEYPEYVILEKTNEQRAKKGLKPLVLSPQLNRAAKLHAQNMAMLDHLSHEIDVRGVSNLSSRLEHVGYDSQAAAENIAWNYTYLSVVAAWMKSPGHRHNIMGDYQEIGIGVSANADGELYFCQVFGRK